MSISPDQIALSADQRERLARLADKTGKSWDAVLQEALASFEQATLARTTGSETVYEAMTRLGLLGSAEGGPADLSTNPEHLEGFGEGEQ